MVLDFVSNLSSVAFLYINFEPIYFSEVCTDNIVLVDGTNFKAEDTDLWVKSKN